MIGLDASRGARCPQCGKPAERCVGRAARCATLTSPSHLNVRGGGGSERAERVSAQHCSTVCHLRRAARALCAAASSAVISAGAGGAAPVTKSDQSIR
eukprot:2056322-Pyramimonas_sp.AAC.1